VRDGGDEDGADLLGPHAGLGDRLAGGRHLMSMTLSSGAAQRRLSMPERSRIQLVARSRSAH
jgi:hypothetical protein